MELENNGEDKEYKRLPGTQIIVMIESNASTRLSKTAVEDIFKYRQWMRYDDKEYERNMRWELEWRLTTEYAMTQREQIKNINTRTL